MRTKTLAGVRGNAGVLPHHGRKLVVPVVHEYPCGGQLLDHRPRKRLWLLQDSPQHAFGKEVHLTRQRMQQDAHLRAVTVDEGRIRQDEKLAYAHRTPVEKRTGETQSVAPTRAAITSQRERRLIRCTAAATVDTAAATVCLAVRRPYARLGRRDVHENAGLVLTQGVGIGRGRGKCRPDRDRPGHDGDGRGSADHAVCPLPHYGSSLLRRTEVRN
jgi:hypothetical protein